MTTTHPGQSGLVFHVAQRGRTVACAVFFALWGVAIAGLIGFVGREQCGPEARGDSSPRLVSAEARGWQVRHWLPLDHPLAPLIAGQLKQKKPVAGIVAEIYLVGHDAKLARELRQRGWRVVEAAGGTEPRLEIFSPERELRWSGVYRGNELRVSGAQIFDDVALRQVARGQAVAPFVPVGCVSVLPTAGRRPRYF